MQTPQSKIQETSQFVLSFKFREVEEEGGGKWGGLFKLGFQISQTVSIGKFSKKENLSNFSRGLFINSTT
jgi:hypothetical protein